MNLYEIHKGEQGDFVEAVSAEEALEKWRAHYLHGTEIEPDGIHVLVRADEYPDGRESAVIR